MKNTRKIIPLLDREFSSNDSYLTELSLRAYEIGSGHVQPSAISRWLN